MRSGREGIWRMLAATKKVGLERAADKLLRNTEAKCSLKKRWAGAFYKCIRTLLRSLWVLFMDSRVSPVLNLPRTKVDHSQFMRVLDIWLKKSYRRRRVLEWSVPLGMWLVCLSKIVW
ncbi:hypothetical protein BDN67DRAFT_819107 [Paxillus ammoniavirescens]|nr:hypothetical protein BDN67DRAFT_819107 [Paxillus ammoniavirescens]